MFGKIWKERTDTRVHSAALLGALALSGLSLIGCQDILSVTDREFLTPEGVSPDLLTAGAFRDFNTAYSGGGLTDRFLSNTALFTDEAFSAGTFPTRTATDQRAQFSISQGNTSDVGYIELHQARRAAIRARRALTEAGVGGSLISDMRVLEGFTYIALGEAYCSGIPFSEVTDEGELIDGPALSTQQIFEAAIVIFDQASGDPAAVVGKGRALLNLGRFSEAAAAVAGVSTSFMRVIEHNDNSGDQENPMFNLQSNGRHSLSEREGGNGLPFRSAGDPRIPWVQDPAGGFEPNIPLYLIQKYTESRSAPVVLADGLEARLIEAEANLNGGNTVAWLAELNALRANVGEFMSARIIGYSSLVPGPNNPTTTLAPLVDPGTQDARVDLMFSERAFWMHVTGHRLGDLRRLVRDYGRSESTVFPVGAYHKGGTYGNDVNLPLDFDETNNPNFTETSCVFSSA
ncbi:MAG: hypothetical protein V3S52_00910 [Gemmatimonadota bacterium]